MHNILANAVHVMQGAFEECVRMDLEELQNPLACLNLGDEPMLAFAGLQINVRDHRTRRLFLVSALGVTHTLYLLYLSVLIFTIGLCSK